MDSSNIQDGENLMDSTLRIGNIQDDDVNEFYENFYGGESLEENVSSSESDNDEKMEVEDAIDEEERPFLTVDVDLELDEVTPESECSAFIKKGCGCMKNCCSLFPPDIIEKSRLDCMELNERCQDHSKHQHLLLLGALNALTNTDEKLKNHGFETSNQRKKNKTDYQFRSKSVCRKFFAFVFGISIEQLQDIKLQFNNNGISPKIHGKFKKSSRSLPLETRQDAKTFIKNFADLHALVLPGRMGSYKNPDLKILPSSMTKVFVFEEYNKATVSSLRVNFSIKTWYVIWKTFCDNVVIQRPRTDLCSVCQSQVLSLSQMANLSESEKLQRIGESRAHLERVIVERTNYKNVCDGIAREIQELPIPLSLGKHDPCSYSGKMHISFDYAQQINIPCSPQQVGELFFLVPYKVCLFGVAIEPLGKFVLYVIPECCVTGKGSNMVISMLDHFLNNWGIGEEDLLINADNCCGQNKNNFLLQYLAWRTMTNRHKSIELSFLPVGHTKFAPDLYFGLFKKKLAKEEVHCLEDIIRVAKSACPKSKSFEVQLVGNLDGETIVKNYDWQSFFSFSKPKRLEGIREVYHLKFSHENPGVAQYKYSVQEEYSKQFRIFKPENKFSDSILGHEVKPAGLSLDRQDYLFARIRKFVNNEAKDRLCPKPLVLLNQPIVVNEVQGGDGQENLSSASNPGTSQNLSVPEPPKRTAAPRKCSICKQIGHNKKNCPNRQVEILSASVDGSEELVQVQITPVPSNSSS